MPPPPPHFPAADHLLSASAAAIRHATSPSSTLHLYNLRRLRFSAAGGFVSGDFYDTHAAVFAVKSLTTLPLLSHFHAHLLKTNLLFHPHVSSSLLHSYSLVSPPLAHHLFDEFPHPCLAATNAMLSSLCRSGRLAAARSLFDSTPDKDIVSFTTLLSGYLSLGAAADALALFRGMASQTALAPDPTMLVALLSGCASVGSVQSICKSVHAYVVRRSIEVSTHLGTAFVDTYAKAGRLDYATRVFASVDQRNVMHWTAMICGVAAQGLGHEALALFGEMRKNGVRPNEITFTGVLNACGHSGLVERGKEFFKIMVEEYGIEPGIHHYGCMIDMFAKAGQLEDAHAIIKNMRMEPNVVMWTAFLAACKKYKNFEFAKEGIEKVLSMEISNDDGGLYSLISDLYAMGGQWDDVLKVRKLMDEHHVKKSRGSSFVEADGLQNSAIAVAN